MKTFKEKVYEEVKKIPLGRVATYSYIAYLVGSPGAARAVGNALNENYLRPPRARNLVPCHRVVKSDGSVGGFARGANEKIKLLREEGVIVADFKVEKKFMMGWLPRTPSVFSRKGSAEKSQGQ